MVGASAGAGAGGIWGGGSESFGMPPGGGGAPMDAIMMVGANGWEMAGRRNNNRGLNSVGMWGSTLEEEDARLVDADSNLLFLGLGSMR